MTIDFMAKFRYMLEFSRVPFEKGLQYRHSNQKYSMAIY